MTFHAACRDYTPTAFFFLGGGLISISMLGKFSPSLVFGLVTAFSSDSAAPLDTTDIFDGSRSV